MKKIELVKVDVNVVIDEVGNGISLEDFNENGIYKILVGSRGMVEKIEFVGGSEMVVREKEDIVNDMIEDENDREYFEEFCDSYSDEIGYYEVISEEDYWLIVNIWKGGGE